MAIDPTTTVANLKGVGPKLAATLAKLGIYRYVDLLLHLPFRYQDRSKLTPLGRLEIGSEHLIEGVIAQSRTMYGGRRSLAVTVTDGVHSVTLRFFHFSRYQQAALQEGRRCPDLSGHVAQFLHRQGGLLPGR